MLVAGVEEELRVLDLDAFLGQNADAVGGVFQANGTRGGQDGQAARAPSLRSSLQPVWTLAIPTFSARWLTLPNLIRNQWTVQTPFGAHSLGLP